MRHFRDVTNTGFGRFLFLNLVHFREILYGFECMLFKEALCQVLTENDVSKWSFCPIETLLQIFQPSFALE